MFAYTVMLFRINTADLMNWLLKYICNKPVEITLKSQKQGNLMHVRIFFIKITINNKLTENNIYHIRILNFHLSLLMTYKSLQYIDLVRDSFQFSQNIKVFILYEYLKIQPIT